MLLQYLPMIWALCCTADAPVLAQLADFASVSTETARTHLIAARRGASPAVDAEILLAMASVESHLRRDWVSGLACDENACARTIARRRASSAPRGLRGPFFCGVLQMRAETWEACLRLRESSLDSQYAAARAHLEMWRAGARCRRFRAPEDLTCALRGYGGNSEANLRYARRILRRAAILRSVAYANGRPTGKYE